MLNLSLRPLLLIGVLLAVLASPTLHAQAETVDLNRADAATLARVLNGVGPVVAERIVAYREANGPFLQIEDLVLVSGIGEKLLARNRERITLGIAEGEPTASAEAEQPR